MNVNLGINTCFALKRWPRPADWASVVRNDLGLDLVELSFDLIEGTETFAGRREAIERTRAALDANGLTAHATFTGLSAYSLDLLMHPDPARREAAMSWYRGMVDLTAALGASATGGHVGAMSVPDWSDPARRAERWNGLKRDLRSIAGHARSAGLEYLLVENLVAVREPSTMAQLEELITEGDDDHVPVAAVSRRRPSVRTRNRGRRTRSVCLAAHVRVQACRGAAAAVGRHRGSPLAVQR